MQRMRVRIKIDEDAGRQDDEEHGQSMRLDGIMLGFGLRIVDVGEDGFIELGARYRMVPSDLLRQSREESRKGGNLHPGGIVEVTIYQIYRLLLAGQTFDYKIPEVLRCRLGDDRSNRKCITQPWEVRLQGCYAFILLLFRTLTLLVLFRKLLAVQRRYRGKRTYLEKVLWKLGAIKIN